VVVNDLGTNVQGAGVSAEPANEVVELIASEGGTAVANRDDVTTVDGCAAMVQTAHEKFGQLDGVLHNAGIHPPAAPFGDVTDDDLEGALRVHLYGAFFLTRAAWPHLAKDKGRLLYITSAVGLYGNPSIAPYAAAKTGVIGLARVAAADGAELGIAANALGVGASTRMSTGSLENAPKAKAWFDKYLSPELPAAAATWLLHPDCPATGRIFDTLGGRMAEVVMTETRGCTQLEWTAEEFRDRFDAITDRNDLAPVDRAAEWQDLGFQAILAAGAEVPELEENAPLFLKNVFAGGAQE
jgi:NAD(P)-dependent dehydrogenase (short-subunit alcohol dehydrogenase family)